MQEPKSTEQEAPEIMTVKDVSAYLRVHPCTIYKALKQKSSDLAKASFKVGSDWRFFRSKLASIGETVALAAILFFGIPLVIAHADGWCGYHYQGRTNTYYVETVNQEVAGHGAATITATCENNDASVGGGFESQVVNSKVKKVARVYVDGSYPAYDSDNPQDSAPVGWTVSVLNNAPFPVTVTSYAVCIE